MVNEAKRRQALETEARRLGLDAVTFEMSEAVPTDLVQEIVKDSRQGVTQPSSMLTEKAEPPKPTQSIERPPEPPPNIDLVDRIVERMIGGPNDTSKLR